METIIERWREFTGEITDWGDESYILGCLLLLAEKLDEQNKLLKEQNELTRQVAIHLQR